MSIRTSKRFTLVRMGEHGPVIRWGPVCFIIAGGLLAFLIAELVQFFVFQTPLRLGLLSAMFTVHLAYLTTALEFQRQNLNANKTRFRFNLTYLFVMTLLAAVFFGSITNEHRVSQRGFQRNDEIRVELDKIIQGGNVYFGAQNGKRISCEITRPDFSDGDLAKLIVEATHRDSKVCEITMLVLEKTAITNDGLQILSACPKLEFLALPMSIALTDPTLETLATCKKLNYLNFNQKKISDAQFDQLSKQLPDTKINGVSYRERQSALQK
jgi:hypothetical protein